MDNISLRNRYVANIRLQEHYYEIEVIFKKTFLEGFTNTLYLVNRNTDEEIKLSATVSEELDEYEIWKTYVDAEDKQLLENDSVWDLSIDRRNEEEESKRLRIKNKPEHLQFYSYRISPDKVIYPFRTAKGNLSFRTNEMHFYANLENIHVKKNGDVHFSGSYNYYPLFHSEQQPIIRSLRLIITHSLNEEEELVFPLKIKDREDLAELYPGNELLGKAGFEGTFSASNFIDLERTKFFKFYLELTYFDGNEEKSLRSIRLRHLKKDRTLPASAILKIEDNKYKILYKLTRKSKYLQVKTSKYSFIRENLSQMKSKWVEVRRGKLLKNAYKVAFGFLGKVLPADNKLIMFESFLGKQYSDNPRAIYEYMRDNHPDYKLFWSSNRGSVNYFIEKNVPYVRRFSIKWLFLMTRSKYWITNSRLPLWIPKPKHTEYLQTWHGTPLKRLAADMDEVYMPGTNTEKYKRNFLAEAAKWDYLVSPNAYSTEIFERAFDFRKTMLETGYPRNDFLYTHNNIETINALKKTIGLPEGKKVILYAPTWRDNQFYQKGKYKFDLEMDLALMREKLGEDYIVLLRLHYLVAENLDLSAHEGFAYDASKHEDIRELYLIADMLITDYSSVFFDYANLKRPMLFFVYDIEDYRDNLRGFYFDFEKTAPGPLVKTTTELIDEIKAVENGFIPTKAFEDFHAKFCYLEDGHATERVVYQVIRRAKQRS